MKSLFLLLTIYLLYPLSLPAQSPALDRILNNIYSGLGNEDDWGATMSDLDDLKNKLEDVDFSSLSSDAANDVRAELKISQVLYDFLGEVSPYSGSNFDISDDDFRAALRFLDQIGVDNSFSVYTDKYDFPVVKLELWAGNVTALLVHNNSDCLHRFSMTFSSGDSMTGGADAHTYRAFTTYGIDEVDPSVAEFSAENVGYQVGCK